MTHSLRRGILLLTGLTACTTPAPDHQVLRLEVAAQAPSADLQVEARCTWLGEERATLLRDDGEAPDHTEGDGIFTATWEGAPVRMLPVRILVNRPEATPVEAYAGVEVLTLDTDLLAWSLELDAPPRARRVPVARSARQVAALELGRVGGSLLWALGVVAFVTWLASRALRARLHEQEASP